VGEACAISSPALFGRGAERDRSDPPKLELFRQRPRDNEPAGTLRGAKVSRRQWLLEPRGTGIWVKNVGRRDLLHNGCLVDECVARAGDTLGIDGAFLVLVELRPRLLPLDAPCAFEFGAPDAAGIVGESPAAWQLRAELSLASAADAHCLILGESGAGKELAAQAIHRGSTRAQGPLVSRNAATIPATLVEAELFGNAANYPNSGSPARPGLVGAADGGTLFLDEIAELGEAQQANLLRVLDSGSYQRLGEERQRTSRFRLLAATNRPLEAMKHDFVARFTERVRVPGLNERRSDVPLLLQLLLTRVGASSRFVHPELVDQLARHHYRHHFRELERLVRLSQRTSPAGVLALTPTVAAELDLPASAALPTDAQIRDALSHGDSVSEAAKRLGLPSRFALYRLMKKLGIES
jgi:DNA-binding NtrC family response regulator